MDSTSNVSLNVTHIADAVKVFDFFADNCPFKGWGNIRQIMALRDRFDAFVKAAEAAEAAQVNSSSQSVLYEGGQDRA
jgi:hypothetical protein